MGLLWGFLGFSGNTGIWFRLVLVSLGMVMVHGSRRLYDALCFSFLLQNSFRTNDEEEGGHSAAQRVVNSRSEGHFYDHYDCLGASSTFNLVPGSTTSHTMVLSTMICWSFDPHYA